MEDLKRSERSCGSVLPGWRLVPDFDGCEAVGGNNYGTNNRPFIEQLSGSTWTVTPSPNPANESILQAVSCVSPSACMAVGFTRNPTGFLSFLRALGRMVERLAWTISPVIDFNAQLTRRVVHDGGRSGRIVAVGWIQGTSAIQPGGILIETWNGSSWSVSVGSQNEIPGNLLSISCPVEGQCMAVGTSSNQNLVVQLSDNSWSEMDAPDPSGTINNTLVSVSCADGGQLH